MKNYILVGLGPHAQRIYYPFLEKHQAHYGICLKLLIELEGQSAKVEAFLRKRALQPEKILYLPDTEQNRRGAALDHTAEDALDDAIQHGNVDGIIISTEPKAHKIYAAWALKNNVHVLMDKPITAPLHPSTDTAAAHAIYQDYMDLEKLRKQGNAKCYIMCQRRNHKGYALIRAYLRDFVAQVGVPISYIDIYHADGAWNFPHEFSKENHPYKYGYGKLMHSGYHFVDLFAWLAGVNVDLQQAKPDRGHIYTARFTPNDFFHQVSEATYGTFFKDTKSVGDFYKHYRRDNYEHLGELDAHILLQLMQDRNVITTGSIHLQQNSFSRRAWFELPEDTYKGNGRVRHERVNIQASQFLNVQVHSYQSRGEGDASIVQGEVGSEDHFDILIFRNHKLIGGDGFTKLTIGKDMAEEHKNDPYYLGHNERAREVTLLHFIEGAADASELESHNLTNQLLANTYASIAEGARTGNPQVTFALPK